MSERESLGELVRKLRREAGLTQKGLADEMGTAFNQTLISKIETNERQPDEFFIQSFIETLFIEGQKRASLLKLFEAATATEKPASSVDLPVGAMSPDSLLYIERPKKDQEAHAEMTGDGATLTLVGPRFVGKSSMLMRLAKTARQHGKKVVILDCRTLFGSHALEDSQTLCRQFCLSLTDELGLDVSQVGINWIEGLSGPRNCERYLKRYLLRQVGHPVVIALEAVDTLFEASADVRNGFFSLLRSWHEQRQSAPASIWRNVDLILILSTEVYQLIDDPTVSPFNVGRIVRLSNFSETQVQELNRRYGQPLSAEEVTKLQNLVNGHPQLVQLALHWATNNQNKGQLFDVPFAVNGPFEVHLKRLLRRLWNQPAQQQALRQVCRENRLDDQIMFIRLEGAGLVRRGAGLKEVLPRCKLYQDYFTAMLFQE